MNIMITFDEIKAYKRFTKKKIVESIRNINYKFECIYFVIDTYINSTLSTSDKDECINVIQDIIEELKEFSYSIYYHIIDYEYSEKYNEYLEYINVTLSDRSKFYKNSLIYLISTMMCPTRYMFHLDGNRGLYKTDNSEYNFCELALDILKEDDNIVSVCVPRKNMQKRLKEYNKNFDTFKSHFLKSKFHMSLQAYIVDIERFKNVVLEHMKTIKRYNLHIEHIIDSSFGQKFPIFCKMENSNIYKEC